jgi:uncharacterized protein
MTRLLPVAIVLLAAVSPSFAQETSLGPATVVALGEGVVRRPADRAVVTLSCEVRAQTAADTQDKGNAQMKAVQSAVAALKLTGSQVTTTGLYLSPDYSYVDNKQTQRGFIARHTITVRFDDVSRAGEVIAASVAAGATNVSGVRFDLRNRGALEQEALKLAVEDARARASALAAGAGRVVDRIVRIVEEQAASLAGGGPTVMRAAAMSESVTVTDAPIAKGDVEVRARVVLTATVK